MPEFSIFPESASTMAGSVDALFWYLSAVTAFFVIAISLANLIFAIKYRESQVDVARPIHRSTPLEIIWSIVPGVIAMTFFAWGANVYYELYTPPSDAMNIYVVGKQWMWKFQHPEGRREINDLHVPTGVPVKLTMTSEDTIHSLFIPAFRTKKDVLPGRYTSIWFEATKPGRYHLFCTEYCGTEHSKMIGSVYVMTPEDYQNWISGGVPGMTMVEAGRQLFEGLGCQTCHSRESGARGPDLVGRYGRPQMLAGGRSVMFDEAYARESILNPAAKVAAGYEPLMPTFQGQISEENLLRILEYIKSLGTQDEGSPGQGSEQ